MVYSGRNSNFEHFENRKYVYIGMLFVFLAVFSYWLKGVKCQDSSGINVDAPSVSTQCKNV